MKNKGFAGLLLIGLFVSGIVVGFTAHKEFFAKEQYIPTNSTIVTTTTTTMYGRDDYNKLVQKMNLYIKTNKELKDELEHTKKLVPDYIWLLQDFRKTHKYNPPDYVCEDISKDFVRVLYQNGYDARTKNVYLKECDPFDDYWKCKHVIVVIDGIVVDPTNFEDEISPNVYKTVYR